MICLVEGFDRTGKGTLCAHLQEDLPDFRYVHFGVPDQEDPFNFFFDRLMLHGGEDLIVDRFHWSNYAYNGTLGGPVLADFDWWRLDHWLAEQGALVVLLVDDPHAIHRRLKLEVQVKPGSPQIVPLSPGEIGQIQNRFFQCYDRSEISHKWSVGLDQLLTSTEHDGQHGWEETPNYVRLLRAIRQEDEG